MKNFNLPQTDMNWNEKEENWSALNNARRSANPFLQAAEVKKNPRLTEVPRASTKNKRKFKHSFVSSNARNSNSQKKEQRFSNKSTSSCGSITKSNKTIRNNKQKVLVGRVKR